MRDRFGCATYGTARTPCDRYRLVATDGATNCRPCRAQWSAGTRTGASYRSAGAWPPRGRYGLRWRLFQPGRAQLRAGSRRGLPAMWAAAETGRGPGIYRDRPSVSVGGRVLLAPRPLGTSVHPLCARLCSDRDESAHNMESLLSSARVLSLLSARVRAAGISRTVRLRPATLPDVDEGQPRSPVRAAVETRSPRVRSSSVARHRRSLPHSDETARVTL